MKFLKGWKTVLFNLASIAAGAGDVLSPEVAFYVVTVGNLILRVMTTSPVGRGE